MSPNPIDKFFTAQKEQNEKRRQQTQDLWHHWDANGRKPEHLEPILGNFQGLIQAKVRDWKPPSIPQSAFEAEVTKHVIKSVQSYKPDKGASLHTHVNYGIQKAKRFMVQQQNMGRMSENVAYRIGDVQRATETLQEDLGRVPTHDEIAQYMSDNNPRGHVFTPKQVRTILSSQRRDIPSTAWESDPIHNQSNRELEILPLLRDTLTPQEAMVFDHIYGHNGVPVIKNSGEMARRLGMSQSKISRIRTSIAAKYKQYL